jgi:hypothetical protein
MKVLILLFTALSVTPRADAQGTRKPMPRLVQKDGRRAFPAARPLFNRIQKMGALSNGFRVQ